MGEKKEKDKPTGLILIGQIVGGMLIGATLAEIRLRGFEYADAIYLFIGLMGIFWADQLYKHHKK